MKAYITLDYELFMGESGTPERCLVVPMTNLTEMLDKYGIKTNLFVDTAYLLQLRKLKEQHPQLQKDYDLVVDHLKQLDKEGHSIQLHLHPQWCYSTYDGNKWVIDKEHYKLSDMPLDDQKRLIHDSVELLNSIARRKVVAFRAGGYSVENFPDLYDTFIEEGINIDSSVFRGEHAKGKYQTYDYRTVPLKSSYIFSGNHKVENASGEMKEYPLSTRVIPVFVYLLNKRKSYTQYGHITSSKEEWGDGFGIGYPGSRLHIMMIKLKMLLGKKAIATHIEVGVNMEKVYNYSKSHYEGDDFVIIGHPKAISPFSIDVFESFIKNHPEIDYKLF